METEESRAFILNAHEESTIIEYDGFEWEVAYEHNPEEYCSTERGIQIIEESYVVYKIGNIFGINVTEEFEKMHPGICELLSEKLTEQFKQT